MIRSTSVAAYHEIKSKGLLSKLRFTVYDTLYHKGPLTQGEAYKFYLSHLNQNSVLPRYAELNKMGVIKAVGERNCRVTGVNCLVWDVTSALPRGLPVKETKKERIEKALNELRGLYKLVKPLKNKPEIVKSFKKVAKSIRNI